MRHHGLGQKIGIGIDFGNSNSTVALYDGQQVSYVPIDPHAPNPQIMPTAIYINRDLLPTVGTRGIDSYLDDNTGRTIKLRKTRVGEIVVTIASSDEVPESYATFTAELNALVDKDLQGRLFRSVKGILGNATLDSFDVFGRRFRLVALLTPIYAHLKQATEEYLGSEMTGVHVGRPVKFAGNSPDPNPRAVRRMREACTHADMRGVVTFPEPVAAALSYMASAHIGEEERILVFDFGGGTLDLSVLTSRGISFTVVGIHGVPLGGDVIDRLVYARRIFPELGQGCTITHTTGPSTTFDFEEFARYLLNWQSTYVLNQPRYYALIEMGLRQGGVTKDRVTRLWHVLRKNASIRILDAIEKAKIALSEDTRTSITLDEVGIHVAIERQSFETLLGEILYDIDGAISEVLRRAGLGPEGISRVVCTGGSSQIPAVRSVLRKTFGDRLVDYDTFRSIAAGLAIANYHGHELDLEETNGNG